MKIIMKVPKILTLFAFLTFYAFSTLVAQEKYVHLMGSTEKNLAVSVDLIINGQKASGFLHTGLESPIAVNGELIDSDSLVLYRELTDKILITYRLDANGKITGKWSDENDSQTIELSESYPEGTQQFMVSAVSSVQPLVDATDSPIAVFNSCIVIPEKSLNKNIADKFQALLYSNFFRTSTVLDSKTMLQNEQSAYFDQYRSKNIDINSPENYPMLNWEKRKVTSIVYNASDIVSLQYQDYTYTGGSAALEISRYLVFDFSSDNQIKLQDLIPEENQSKVSKKIKEAICLNLNLDTSTNLKNNGFFSNEVFVSDNFYLTGYGIGFHYNTYELAGQETGPISVFLPFDSLQGLLSESDIFERITAK